MMAGDLILLTDFCPHGGEKCRELRTGGEIIGLMLRTSFIAMYKNLGILSLAVPAGAKWPSRAAFRAWRPPLPLRLGYGANNFSGNDNKAS